MIFYLGAPDVAWLGTLDVPLMVSARRMRRRRRLPDALCPFGLDSGGFSELSLYGRWVTSPRRYASEVRHWSERTQNLAWAAVQDWMCEPSILARTGLTVADHQRRTIASYHQLGELAPEVEWVPVLQGWSHADYISHARQHEDAGICLGNLPLVGLGSICRRQDTLTAEEVIKELSGDMALHAFGVKTLGLRRVGHLLASADSMAWSLRARRGPPMAGCTHRHCNNCRLFARAWRDKVVAVIDGPKQLTLF